MSDILRRLHNIIRSRLSSPQQENDPNLYEHHWETRDQREAPGAENNKKTEERLDPLLAQWYANLEVPYGSDLKTVKQAWRMLMKRYHPDLHSRDPKKKEIATELTQKLTEAYQGLEKRLKKG